MNEVCTEGKTYIKFELIRNTTKSKAKTNVYFIKNIKHDIIIGTIKWSIGWRQYCFYPNFDTVWSTGCLEEVKCFIKKLMEARKK